MYLKSLKLTNFRKFRDGENVLEIAHESNKYEEPSKLNVSKNTTMIVGRNNSGKTTVLGLLSKLSQSKSGSTSLFNVHDFNLNYLKSIYDKIIVGSTEYELPTIKFQLEVGIDDLEHNSLAYLEEILLIKDIGKAGSFKIDILYQALNEVKLRTEFDSIYSLYEKQPVRNLENIEKELYEKLKEKSLKECIEYCDEHSEREETNKKGYQYIKFQKEELFRKYLTILSNATYELAFFPEGSDDKADNFSLSNLLDVKMVKANNINGENCLSKAYNKIIKSFLSNNQRGIDQLLEDINFETKSLIDTNYTQRLNGVVQKIESSKNLEMNLISAIKMDDILKNAVTYEYLENENYIPENQFGLGYTNLMVIIAELVEYIDMYKEQNYTDKINLICIEEPETYMHPQMQELFITNIEEAINTLYDSKDFSDFRENIHKINYQLLISTHSPHILNSKIHQGNKLDNINYLTHTNTSESTGKIIPLKDDKIIGQEIKKRDKKSTENSNEAFVEVTDFQSLTYIKKHMRVETSNIMFSDAVVIVEGPTEEAYLKYLISQDSRLKKLYITVLCINGAYGKVYFKLLKLMHIPTILYTDIDFNRTDEAKKGGYEQLKDLSSELLKDSAKLTTNSTLKYFLDEKNDQCAKVLHTTNQQLLELKTDYYKDQSKDEQYFMYDFDSLFVITQGKVHDSYATSLEEAILLTNAETESKYLNELLRKMMPHIYKEAAGGTKESEADLKEKAFYFQIKIGSSSNKTKFMNQILFDLITKDNKKIDIPIYIKLGLDILAHKLGVEGGV
ncbi:ATP-dependent endonuclease [Vagococcus sp. PNs007]|uniref:ATP-dependent endonuclease n=1 Tax=Vagococcus proximus TaxID=2991417 RepID=A0ABT5X1W3_9ENTE|nr:AAA family ATPase [Vagococcus proximus]MDF0479907.1 ATP-dependent endonuclease [Vagococcus proximus]